MAAEELPGFVPWILRADDVSLLRADETVFEAMLDGRLFPICLSVWSSAILCVAPDETEPCRCRR